MKARDLFFKQRRFDLIYKYLYVKKYNDFNRNAYIEHIRAFNGGHEDTPSDGVAKDTISDFVKSFDKLISSIKSKGYDESMGLIPIQQDGEICDGAHRLSICAAFDKDIETLENKELHYVYPYTFFLAHQMDQRIMDYGALEYVKINPHAHIVNMQSITSPKHDEKIIDILEKYGFIYYKKSIRLTPNGLVNFKKVSYGAFWEKEPWIGNVTNGFAGAVSHANQSRGKYPNRVFVFVCDNIDKVIQAKAEIRDLYGKGNFSVHINDTHEEAVWLAEMYFNENTLFWTNNTPYRYEDSVFDELIETFKEQILANNEDIDNYCLVDAAVLNAFGMRHTDMINYVTISSFCPDNKRIQLLSQSQLKNYGAQTIEDIVTNPNNYFYYKGVKMITLPLTLKMKLRRRNGRDIADCFAMFALCIRTLSITFDKWKVNLVSRLKGIPWLVDSYLIIKHTLRRKR